MTIKNNAPVENLLEKLPSFYSEFIYDDKFIKVLFDSYIESIKLVSDYLQSVNYNTTVNTAELYRRIDSAVLTLHNCLYDVHTVAQDFTNEGNGNWFDSNTSLQTKVAFLESKGYYERLESRREWDSQPGKVINLEISKDFSGTLGFYVNSVDYVILNNRLFVFNELAKPVAGGVKQVLAKNIFIDVNKLENRWGILFKSITNKYMSRVTYKDFLQALITFTPTIANIRDITETLSFTPTNDLRDKFTRKNLPEEYLHTPDYLDEFDFVYKLSSDFNEAIYYIPPGFQPGALSRPYDEAVYDMDYYIYEKLVNYYTDLSGKLSDLTNFLNLMKPAYTDFMLEGTMPIPLDLGGELKDSPSVKPIFSVPDSLVPTDNVSVHLITSSGKYNEAIYGKVKYGGTI